MFLLKLLLKFLRNSPESFTRSLSKGYTKSSYDSLNVSPGISSGTFVGVATEVPLKFSLGSPADVFLVVFPKVLLGVPLKAAQDFPGVPSKANPEVPLGTFLWKFFVLGFSQRICLAIPLEVPPEVHRVFCLEILLDVLDFYRKVPLEFFSGLPM